MCTISSVTGLNWSGQEMNAFDQNGRTIGGVREMTCWYGIPKVLHRPTLSGQHSMPGINVDSFRTSA
jgi:hypothetical protein